MLVKASWEFDVDISDFDEKHVDIKGLAIDLTKREVEHNLSNNEFSAEDFKYEIVEDEEKENNAMEYVKVEMILGVNTEEDAKLLKKLEHHAEYLLDLDYCPEIKSVHGVKVITKATNPNLIVSRKMFRVKENTSAKGDVMIQLKLDNPTVGDMVSLLSGFNPEAKFYTTGCSSFNLYIDENQKFCTVDESDTIYE